jgi:hypothetical protein
MGGKLGTDQAGPGLPKGSEMAVPLPVLLNAVQAGGNPYSRCPWSWHQQGDVSHHALLKA